MEKRSSPPKKLKIKGQPHKLAYINDVEEGLLRARGGSGEMVYGVPAFYDEGDDYDSPNATDADRGANKGTTRGDGSGVERYGISENDQAVAQAQARENLERSLSDEAARAAREGRAMVNSYANPYANSGLTAQDRAFQTAPNAQRVAQSYLNSLGTNGRNIFAPSVFSNNLIGGSIKDAYQNKRLSDLFGVSSYSSWFDDVDTRKAVNDLAMERLQDRLDGYNSRDSYVEKAINPIRSYFGSTIMDDLKNGGRPVFDELGQVQGSFNKNMLGLEVYTGNPIEGMPETGWLEKDYASESDPIENPLTGEQQCPDGYFYDEDLQSCRLGSPPATSEDIPSVTAPAVGAYYRPQGLEQAPAFMPAGFDYDAANSAFLDSYAYRPDDFVDPMSLNGFKQIT